MLACVLDDVFLVDADSHRGDLKCALERSLLLSITVHLSSSELNALNSHSYVVFSMQGFGRSSIQGVNACEQV